MESSCCFLYGAYILGVILIYKIFDWIIRLPKIGGLDQQYFFITGCDSGFGNNIAKKLDKHGCHVFAACLTETAFQLTEPKPNPEAAKQVTVIFKNSLDNIWTLFQGETDLRKSCSDRLKTLHMDVSSHESVLRGFQFVRENLPAGKGLSGILNNAGIGGIGPIEWLQLQYYQRTLDINLLGVIDVTTTFLPLVKKAKGRIVNTASILGRYSNAGATAYNISKYGVEAFSDALRREMRPFKVSVHIIEPGFFKTNIMDENVLLETLDTLWEQMPQEVKDQYGEEYLTKSKEVMLKTVLEGNVTKDISGVVNAYAHALTGFYPRARYVVGTDAKLFWLPMQYMPEWLGDFLMERLRRMSGAPTPAGASN